MSKGFVRLGKGCSLNASLVDYVAVVKGRYFVKDIYGGSYEVDKKHFNAIVKQLGPEILKKKENR